MNDIDDVERDVSLRNRHAQRRLIMSVALSLCVCVCVCSLQRYLRLNILLELTSCIANVPKNRAICHVR